MSHLARHVGGIARHGGVQGGHEFGGRSAAQVRHGPAREQHLHHPFPLPESPGGGAESGAPDATDGVHFGAPVEQQFHDGGVFPYPAASGGDECRAEVAAGPFGVDVGAGVEEQLDDSLIVGTDSDLERVTIVAAGDVDVRAVLQQQFDDFQTLVPVLGVTFVDVVAGTAFNGRLQSGRVLVLPGFLPGFAFQLRQRDPFNRLVEILMVTTTHVREIDVDACLDGDFDTREISFLGCLYQQSSLFGFFDGVGGLEVFDEVSVPSL